MDYSSGISRLKHLTININLEKRNKDQNKLNKNRINGRFSKYSIYF